MDGKKRIWPKYRIKFFFVLFVQRRNVRYLSQATCVSWSTLQDLRRMKLVLRPFQLLETYSKPWAQAWKSQIYLPAHHTPSMHESTFIWFLPELYTLWRVVSFISKDKQNYFSVRGEQLPHRHTKSQRFIAKVMFCVRLLVLNMITS